jgi:hypothetical protein
MLRRPLLLALLAALVLAVGAPAASADCGKTVIDQYFSTGVIKYHEQKCYDSALKQIDPDARMYSGIMAAIRAARARDRARDAKAAESANETDVVIEDGGVVDTPIPEPVDEVVPEFEVLPAEEIPPPLDESARAALEPDPVTTAALAAVAPEIDEPPVTPLAVLMVGGLASLVTVAGLVGVAARRLTGRL